MSHRLLDAEVFGVTESTITVACSVDDEEGRPLDTPVRVRLDGEVRAETAEPGLRLMRIEGLEPGREYRFELEADGCAPPAEAPAILPAAVTTLQAPSAAQTATLATLNDLHFGEHRFGGIPGVADDLLPADYTDEPYWRFMNRDAIADINAAEVDAVIIKGDIADGGTAEQFREARRAFDTIECDWHAFLGNHDAYGDAFEVGYQILDQEPAPRAFTMAGWRLVFVDTVAPHLDRGRIESAQLEWLDAELGSHGQPTLIFMHHQPVPPRFARGMINQIGVRPTDSAALFAVIARHPHTRGVLIGHTHRNRVRRYPEAGGIPFAEVSCTKDYPGAWAHYRLFADGSFHQEVRRTSSARARAHSRRCGRMFEGKYRAFALGALQDRSFQS